MNQRSAKRLNRGFAGFAALAGYRKLGECLGRLRRVDPAQNIDRPALPPGCAVKNDDDRRDSARVLDLGKLSGSLIPSGRVQEPGLPASEQRKPVAIGEALTLEFGSQGGNLLLVHPAAVIPSAAQALPRRAVCRIKTSDLCQVGNRFGLQPLLLAPEGELPVSRDRSRDGSPPGLVLGEQRRELVVGLLAAGGLIRLQPLVLDLDLAQKSARRGTGGVRPDGELEQAMALAVVSSCFALQRLPDQCRWRSNRERMPAGRGRRRRWRT